MSFMDLLTALMLLLSVIEKLGKLKMKVCRFLKRKKTNKKKVVVTTNKNLMNFEMKVRNTITELKELK